MGIKDNSLQEDLVPPQFNLNTEVEIADDYNEAVQNIISRLPAESKLLHVQVITNGQTKTIYGYGLTEEDGFHQARIPSNVTILERTLVHKASRRIVSIRASDESDAERKVRHQISMKSGREHSIKTLKLLSHGRNWGLWRSQNLYQVEAIELAEVKIVYKTKVHIVAKTGDARAILKGILADELTYEQKHKRIEKFLTEIGEFKVGEEIAACTCGYPFGIRQSTIYSITQSPMDVNFLLSSKFLYKEDANDNFYRSYFICPNCGTRVGETWIP
jgi:hypothetical protein